MTNIFNEICRTDLDNIACIVEHEEFSYRDLFCLVDGLANELAAHQIGPGDRVGLQGLGHLDLLVAYYACARTGAVAVPISFREPERIRGAIASASVLLTIDEIAEPGQPYEGPAQSDYDEAMVIYTSGTTSTKLKGVRLAHAGISSTARFMNRQMEVDDSLRELVFAALDHAYGFGRCHAVLSIGGVIVLPRSLDNPLLLFKLFEQHRCNALAVAPSIISTMMHAAPAEIAKLGTALRWMQTGAMRFDQTRRQQLLDLLPNTRIFLHYGLSEAMRVTLFELNALPDKIATEGPASDGVELRIVDEAMNALPRGQEGLITIRGTNLCLGYLDRDQWDAVCHEGWFVTSDNGLLDEDGFLVFHGRADDVINLNGELVHPDEIESRLVTLLPDDDYVVVGIPDPAGIKDMVAVLVVEGDTAPASSEIAKHLAGSDRNLVPTKVTTIPRIPRTRSGKVQRSAIARQLVHGYSPR